jgi:hypothetical protein
VSRRRTWDKLTKAVQLAIEDDPRIPDYASVRLDFEIDTTHRGDRNEHEARGVWYAHVTTHAEALASLAVDLTTGDAHRHAETVANRLRALLHQGRAALAPGVGGRLDLAAPLPKVQPWPPLFAGERSTSEMAALMATPLQWSDVYALAAWAHAFAYFATGMLHGTPPAVRAQARGRLHRLLDAASEGLDLGEPPRGPAGQKGGAK